MISRKDLRTELKWYRSYGNALRSALQKLPQGSLYYKMEHGAPRPYMRVGGREKYLPSRKKNLIRDLARRKDIEDSLRKVDQNIILLRQAEQSYYDYQEILLPNADIGMSPPASGLTSMISAAQHEKLTPESACFSEDPAVRFGPDPLPDDVFAEIIRQASATHDAKSVMYRYMNAGYWPYDNLITTFDFTDGGVDLTELQRILDLMILDPDL